MPIGVFRGARDHRRLRDRGHRHVDHLRARIGRERDRLRDAIAAIDRLVASLDAQEPAVGAYARAENAVVGFGDELAGLAVRMAVGAVVGLWIVGVAMEIPAGNIVNVAVVIVVLAVAESDDQIFAGRAAKRRMEVRRMDARIVSVVIGGQRAIAVEVVQLVRFEAVRRLSRDRRAVRFFGGRQLAAVEIRLAPQVNCVGEPPVDAALDIGHDQILPSVAEFLPGPIEKHPRRTLGIGSARSALRKAIEQVPLLAVEARAGTGIAFRRRVIGIIGAKDRGRAREPIARRGEISSARIVAGIAPPIVRKACPTRPAILLVRSVIVARDLAFIMRSDH